MHALKEIKGGFLMITVGIDVASEKHDICIMNDNAEVFEKIFSISNTKSDYKKLLSKIEEAKKLWNDSKVCIGIESTGVYSEVIVHYLSDIEDLEIVYINPILTNMFQHSEVVHYAKTDKIDAKGICMYLQSKNKRLFTYTKPSYHTLEMKSLTRELVSTNKQINQITNRLTGILHIVFPEFFKIFKKIKGKSCLMFLQLYPTPDALSKKRNLNNVFADFIKGRRKDNIDNLIDLAKNSIGSYSKSDGIIISELAKQIEFLNLQKEVFINQLDKLAEENCQLLLSIPGVGAITACSIMGEIGDISNFRGGDSLLAFAGLNPRVYQSGKCELKGLSISKKGSSYLRTSIIQASRQIVRRDPWFKSYFNSKMAQGKHYNTSIGHVSKKLTHVIYQILKTGKPFEPRTVTVNN